MVDNPAYVLDDDVYVVPQGASFAWLVTRLLDDGKIPLQVVDPFPYFEEYGRFPTTVMPAAQVSNIPVSIGTSLALHSIRDIYPLSRPQCFPEAVQCIKFKTNLKLDQLLSTIRQVVGNQIDDDNL